MRVTVLGAGSWGTTVASLASGRNDTLLWARDAAVADTIRSRHENDRYLAGYPLPEQLDATDDLERAARLFECSGAILEAGDVERSLIDVAMFAGDYAAAEALLREALELSSEIRGPEHPDTVSYMNNLAGMLMMRGQLAKADPLGVADHHRGDRLGEDVLPAVGHQQPADVGKGEASRGLDDQCPVCAFHWLPSADHLYPCQARIGRDPLWLV